MFCYVVISCLLLLYFYVCFILDLYLKAEISPAALAYQSPGGFVWILGLAAQKLNYHLITTTIVLISTLPVVKVFTDQTHDMIWPSGYVQSYNAV